MSYGVHISPHGIQGQTRIIISLISLNLPLYLPTQVANTVHTITFPRHDRWH